MRVRELAPLDPLIASLNPVLRGSAQYIRTHGLNGFGEELMVDLDSEAIDLGAASQCFAERRALRRNDLETLGLVRRH